MNLIRLLKLTLNEAVETGHGVLIPTVKHSKTLFASSQLANMMVLTGIVAGTTPAL
jgi:hypothetical protein